MRRILGLSSVLRVLVLGGLVLLTIACGSSKSGDGAGTGGAGTGGSPTGTGGATTGTGGGTTGTGGSVVAAGGAGGAIGGTAGAGGTGSPVVAPLVGCSDGDYAGVANPADFSINADTHAADQHSLVMTRGDVIRRSLQYMTGGPADHKHQVVFTDAQLVALMAGQSVSVMTFGPPLNASSGHSHTLTVSSCGTIP